MHYTKLFGVTTVLSESSRKDDSNEWSHLRFCEEMLKKYHLHMFFCSHDNYPKIIICYLSYC